MVVVVMVFDINLHVKGREGRGDRSRGLLLKDRIGREGNGKGGEGEEREGSSLYLK